ncbi:hypothetical protein D3C76_1612470 [compost metagenome]
MTTTSALSGSSGVDCMYINGAGILFSWPETHCFMALRRAMQALLQSDLIVVLVRVYEVIGAHKIGTFET